MALKKQESRPGIPGRLVLIFLPCLFLLTPARQFTPLADRAKVPPIVTLGGLLLLQLGLIMLHFIPAWVGKLIFLPRNCSFGVETIFFRFNHFTGRV
jgi:hypothetical protein